MKNLLIATAAIASVCVATPRMADGNDRLDALETRLDKIESRMMARDHLLVLSAAWVLDRMDLVYQEQSGDAQDTDVATLRQQVRAALREGAKLTSGMHRLLAEERIRVALQNYHAATELRDDVFHRIRIFQEEKIGDGPEAAERRRRQQAWIDWFKEYEKRTPDPEKVKQLLDRQKK